MKVIEAIADKSYMKAIYSVAEREEVQDHWVGPEGEDGRQNIWFLVDPEKLQATLDALQAILGNSPTARILLVSMEAVLPLEEKSPEEKSEISITSREELYADIEKSARLDSTFLLLVFLSTVVVGIGLLEDNMAVVIGAMVIAPLLGPNIALGLATALGDSSLMWKSVKTSLAGVSLALVLSICIGLTWPHGLASEELLARTKVGLDSAALAFASGAAAVLSLTTGLPSVLVGVMVAVALLPPTATMGIMLGAGEKDLAMGATLLLAVNVVCLNLAAKVGFFIQGITPRTWKEKKKAQLSMTAYVIFWIIALAVLFTAIYARNPLSFQP